MTVHEQRGPIDACMGDTIELSAPGEGVGGFLWHAEIPAGVGTVVGERLGDSKSGVGSGPDKVFRLRLERAGDATVRLVQRRPWDSAAARVIEVPIRCAASRKG